ncbi:MAG TPA: inositol monophosphatase family protein [Myxococcaceae bacterium]|nr:inositol monophosphatase family protein [Myxococcaceae bacterium]
MSEAAEWMEAAEAVARVAGTVALGHYRAGVRVEVKGDGTPVSVADRQAEEAARGWLEARFPQDGILGEELGLARPEARRRWLVDPIDGTRTFVRRVPLWGSLVALVEGEEVLAGAAYFPAVEELVVAAREAGCFWNGRRTRVSETARLEEAAVLATDECFGGHAGQRARWSRLAERAALVRTWGDCYGYLLVATGRAEVMVDGAMAPWDAAPLQPIIEEAGGVFSDWSGRRSAFGGSTIATNAGVAAAVRVLLVAPGK